jgi:hypothetical protein
MNAVVGFPGVRRTSPLHFTRAEFLRLLSLYSSRVMTGEWRDYAFSFGPEKANFFIFRHSFENPLFVISKRLQRGRGRQSQFEVSSGGQKLCESASLENALAVFRRPVRLIAARDS